MPITTFPLRTATVAGAVVVCHAVGRLSTLFLGHDGPKRHACSCAVAINFVILSPSGLSGTNPLL